MGIVGGGSTEFVGVAETTFVSITGAGFVGTTGAGLGGGGTGGQLVSTVVPMMISGSPTGGLTSGAGGGGFVGSGGATGGGFVGVGGAGGAGGGGNSGMLTMPGGKFIVQPAYWPNCVRKTRTNGWRVFFCSACRCLKTWLMPAS